jgi:hypothetical protein
MKPRGRLMIAVLAALALTGLAFNLWALLRTLGLV